MTIVLALGLYALAMVFLFALCLTVAVSVVFREPGLLGLAAIFAAITALLIAAGVAL